MGFVGRAWAVPSSRRAGRERERGSGDQLTAPGTGALNRLCRVECQPTTDNNYQH